MTHTLPSNRGDRDVMQERLRMPKRVTHKTHLLNNTYVCYLLIDPRWRLIKCIDDSASVLSAACVKQRTLRPEVVFLFINSTSAPHVYTTNAMSLSHLPLY